MKKIILGCSLIICATICFCTLVLCGFVVCTGEGTQGWSFRQFGFSSVIQDLTWLAVAIPIILAMIGIGFVISSFKETTENKRDRS